MKYGIQERYEQQIVPALMSEFGYDNLMQVFKISRAEGVATHRAADRLSETRIKSIANLRQHHHGRMARPFSTLKEMTNRQK